MIDLNITAVLTDLDGSEILSAITFSDVPDNAQLSAGTKNNNGSWTVTNEDLAGLQITPAKDSYDDFELSLSVTSTDSNGSTSTSLTSLPVTVVATADKAVITGSGDTVTEDSPKPASGKLSITDRSRNKKTGQT